MLLDGMLLYYRLRHIREFACSCRRDMGRHGAFDLRDLLQASKTVRR